jgi:hypothetical protein
MKFMVPCCVAIIAIDTFTYVLPAREQQPWQSSCLESNNENLIPLLWSCVLWCQDDSSRSAGIDLMEADRIDDVHTLSRLLDTISMPSYPLYLESVKQRLVFVGQKQSGSVLVIGEQCNGNCGVPST